MSTLSYDGISDRTETERETEREHGSVEQRARVHRARERLSERMREELSGSKVYTVHTDAHTRTAGYIKIGQRYFLYYMCGKQMVR